MSQEKVDRYKEEKKNRKVIQAKKKRKVLIEKICAGAIVLALVCWIGYTAWDSNWDSVNNRPVTADVTALDDYMTSLNAE